MNIFGDCYSSTMLRRKPALREGGEIFSDLGKFTEGTNSTLHMSFRHAEQTPLKLFSGTYITDKTKNSSTVGKKHSHLSFPTKDGNILKFR